MSSSVISIKDDQNYTTNSMMIEAFVPPLSVLSSERNNFPGLNSRVETRSPHYTPISFTSLRQADKIQVTDLSELASTKLGYQPVSGNLVVKWIPDIRHRLLLSERPLTKTPTPTQRMCVKDLALESLLSFKDSKENYYPNQQKRKKSNKVPTGGQPYLLHLRRYPKIPANKSSSPTGKEKKVVECSAGKRKSFPQHLQLFPLAEVQSREVMHLEAKRRLLPGSKQKESSPLTVQKVPCLYRFEPKVPVEGKSIRRIQSQFKDALEGPRVPKHLASTIAQQLNSAPFIFQTSESYGRKSERRNLLYRTCLSQEASAEKSCLPECSPQISQVAINRRKSASKYVEYKSNRASLFMEGYDSSIHQISKSESKYKQYCKQIAIRKGAALAQGDLSIDNEELWLGEAAQKSENLLQPSNPPPPPPSPLISECSDSPSQDLT
ncbi:uncharacterized protein C9orf43 homolog isoform X2 [Eublepharis macularius]|nr:uncharacterized protein C9orf43 homolog isoform X2 [Eublepharis macularius]